ncbi:MAG: hypothetical protein RBT74_15505 [Tenuifilaceae bacterium]|jgi:hypothetical protein|nr:hypothetical protein [Tenuifilaceae bacterium]
MGKVTDSFKRQVGRDAGKVVSNFLFGDKHATPIRHVRAKEKFDAEIAHQKEIQSQASAHQRQLFKMELKQKRQNYLYNLKKTVENDVLEINAIETGTTKDELISTLRELSTRIEINKWQNIIIGNNVKEKSITNHIPSAYLNKYIEVLNNLKSKYPENKDFESFEKRLKWFRIKKILFIFKWFFIILIIITTILVLGFIGG